MSRATVAYGRVSASRQKDDIVGKVAQYPQVRPRILATGDLSQLRGKAKSKNISRLCSSWARNANQERITIHAYVGGSDVKTVNAACTSQTYPDPACGYVSLDNRHGDTFHRRNPYWICNWRGGADYVAAMNIKSRIDDREINRFTPYGEVKKILDPRFLRRMESRDATAHGRTPRTPRRTRTRRPDVRGASIDTDSQSPGGMDKPEETHRLENENKRSA